MGQMAPSFIVVPVNLALEHSEFFFLVVHQSKSWIL